MATPAKVGYDVPVYNYQYVPVQQQGCKNGCCGCTGKVTVSNFTNLYQYGEEIPEDKYAQKKPTYKWSDVVRRFGVKYGNDTFDTSLLDQGENGDKVYTLEEIASLLGIKGQKKQEYLSQDHDYQKDNLIDPEGYEWVDVPQNWKQETVGNAKWTAGKNQNQHNVVFSGGLESYSKFH